MDENIRLRVRHAAIDWLRTSFGRDGVVEQVSEAVRLDDGSLCSDVTLCCEEPGQHQERLHCLVTLEPDGRISCFRSDATEPSA
jgi:hypothetical protein